MTRLMYESSYSYKGYLIIPFVFGKADAYEIYSYKLLSSIGSRSKLHKQENPAGIYASSISSIINIACEYIDDHLEFLNYGDVFKRRYTYRDNLIILFQECGKFFYDHYAPESLNNIAAPKIFKSEQECLGWIKAGLDESHTRREVK